MSNLSQEVTAVKNDLIKSVEDTESDRQSDTSSPQLDQNILSDLETHLKELVVSHQFPKAIKTLHQIRGHFPGFALFSLNDVFVTDYLLKVILVSVSTKTTTSTQSYRSIVIFYANLEPTIWL